MDKAEMQYEKRDSVEVRESMAGRSSYITTLMMRWLVSLFGISRRLIDS
jgi:hypothetical protein